MQICGTSTGCLDKAGCCAFVMSLTDDMAEPCTHTWEIVHDWLDGLVKSIKFPKQCALVKPCIDGDGSKSSEKKSEVHGRK
jgi:hypothetical protein